MDTAARGVEGESQLEATPLSAPPAGAGPEIIAPVELPEVGGRGRRVAVLFARAAYPLLRGLQRVHSVGAREAAMRSFAACGERVGFDPLTSIISYEQVSVGSNVYIGPGAYFFGEIEIGDDVLFGPEVHVQAGYHRFDIVGKLIRESGGDERRKVVIGSDVWVAARTSIMKGVTIGDGAVIGTGAIVTRDVPAYTIAIGSPARVLRKRFEDDELREHLRLRGRTDDEIARVVDDRNAALREHGL